MEIIVREVNKEEISALAKVANEVWHEYFVSILSEEQIDYMVDKFQSEHAMLEQVEHENYQYYFMLLGEEIVGYIGMKPKEEKLFLSKLYLRKDYRGKGYASQAFAFLENWCKKHGKEAIWLTVNKQNEHSIAVYQRKGFEITASQVADIGNGFVMDDYIMQKTL